MKTQTTSAARKIARAHNERIAAGFAGNGKLVFGHDGSGGAWYSGGAYGFGDDTLVVPMRWHKITAQEVQEML